MTPRHARLARAATLALLLPAVTLLLAPTTSAEAQLSNCCRAALASSQAFCHSLGYPLAYFHCQDRPDWGSCACQWVWMCHFPAPVLDNFSDQTETCPE